MAAFINKKAGPPSLELKDKDALEKFIAVGGVVAYISGGEESPEYKNWVRAATSGQLEDFTLAHVFDSAISGDYKDTVVIYKAGDEPIAYTGDKITKTQVIEFVNAEGYPLYEEISQSVWQRSQTGNKPLLALFVDFTKEDEKKVVQEVAKHLKGSVVVSYAPLPEHKQLAERWGASGNYLPTAILVDWKNSESPVLTAFNEDTEKDGFVTKSVLAFVESALKDEYQTYLKSEPIPENQNGPLYTLVGKTIEAEINDPKKNVFVEFYAPWCGHCKKLAPIWGELADAFASDDSVKIAKIDATSNNLPKNLVVRGYPTLIFFPANDKKGISYEGERDLESLTKFVNENSVKSEKSDL